jgi:hypothetical protein
MPVTDHYWAKPGQTPAPAPSSIRLSDGTLRTDPTTFTEAELNDAGYTIKADPPPSAQPWQRVVWDGERWTTPDRDLADVQAETRAAVRQEAESRLRPLLDEYNEPERLSWERQLEQARAFKADSTASTPLMDALATARGLTRDQMADRIIGAADTFESQAGAILGLQQAAEGAAKNATTAEDAYKARDVDWPS